MSFAKSLLIGITSRSTFGIFIIWVRIVRRTTIGVHRLIFPDTIFFLDFILLLLLFLNYAIILFLFLWNYAWKLYEIVLFVFWIVPSVGSFLRLASRFILAFRFFLFERRRLLHHEVWSLALNRIIECILGFLIFTLLNCMSEVGSRLWDDPSASEFLFENGIGESLLLMILFFNVEFPINEMALFYLFIDEWGDLWN